MMILEDDISDDDVLEFKDVNSEEFDSYGDTEFIPGEEQEPNDESDEIIAPIRH